MLGKLTGLFDFGHLLSLQLSLLLKNTKVCSILNLVNTEKTKITQIPTASIACWVVPPLYVQPRDNSSEESR